MDTDSAEMSSSDVKKMRVETDSSEASQSAADTTCMDTDEATNLPQVLGGLPPPALELLFPRAETRKNVTSPADDSFKDSSGSSKMDSSVPGGVWPSASGGGVTPSEEITPVVDVAMAGCHSEIGGSASGSASASGCLRHDDADASDAASAEDGLLLLVGMGFDGEQARKALAKYHGKLC